MQDAKTITTLKPPETVPKANRARREVHFMTCTDQLVDSGEPSATDDTAALVGKWFLEGEKSPPFPYPYHFELCADGEVNFLKADGTVIENKQQKSRWYLDGRGGRLGFAFSPRDPDGPLMQIAGFVLQYELSDSTLILKSGQGEEYVHPKSGQKIPPYVTYKRK